MRIWSLNLLRERALTLPFGNEPGIQLMSHSVMLLCTQDCAAALPQGWGTGRRGHPGLRRSAAPGVGDRQARAPLEEVQKGRNILSSGRVTH